MKTYRPVPLLLLVAAPVLVVAGCGRNSSPNDDSDHARHEHVAPHGGTLVEIGDHAYNVELVRDRTEGKLSAWVLDGHAEDFVRLTSPSIELVAMPGGKYTPLSLQPVANPATGETAGDTSQFEAQADWLKTAGAFAGILTVEIKGTRYEQVPYALSD